MRCLGCLSFNELLDFKSIAFKTDNSKGCCRDNVVRRTKTGLAATEPTGEDAISINTSGPHLSFARA